MDGSVHSLIEFGFDVKFNKIDPIFDYNLK